MGGVSIFVVRQDGSSVCRWAMEDGGRVGAGDGARPLGSHWAQTTTRNIPSAQRNLTAAWREHRPCPRCALSLLIVLLLWDWNRILQVLIQFLFNLIKTLPGIFNIALKSIPSLWTSSKLRFCYSYLGNVSSHWNTLYYEPRCPF